MAMANAMTAVVSAEASSPSGVAEGSKAKSGVADWAGAGVSSGVAEAGGIRVGWGAAKACRVPIKRVKQIIIENEKSVRER
jgi:hypothetical protein